MVDEVVKLTSAETGVFWETKVNLVIIDIMVPCVVRSSADMVLVLRELATLGNKMQKSCIYLMEQISLHKYPETFPGDQLLWISIFLRNVAFI